MRAVENTTERLTLVGASPLFRPFFLGGLGFVVLGVSLLIVGALCPPIAVRGRVVRLIRRPGRVPGGFRFLRRDRPRGRPLPVSQGDRRRPQRQVAHSSRSDAGEVAAGLLSPVRGQVGRGRGVSARRRRSLLRAGPPARIGGRGDTGPVHRPFGRRPGRADDPRPTRLRTPIAMTRRCDFRWQSVGGNANVNRAVSPD